MSAPDDEMALAPLFSYVTVSNILLSLVAGLLVTILWGSKRVENEQKQRGPLYRLDHGKLNIPVPPPSMWMNMGFWKVPKLHSLCSGFKYLNGIGDK